MVSQKYGGESAMEYNLDSGALQQKGGGDSLPPTLHCSLSARAPSYQ